MGKILDDGLCFNSVDGNDAIINKGSNRTKKLKI